MCLDVRKPVFEVCNQVRFKHVCSTTKHLEISHVASMVTVLTGASHKSLEYKNLSKV